MTCIVDAPEGTSTVGQSCSGSGPVALTWSVPDGEELNRLVKRSVTPLVVDEIVEHPATATPSAMIARKPSRPRPRAHFDPRIMIVPSTPGALIAAQRWRAKGGRPTLGLMVRSARRARLEP